MIDLEAIQNFTSVDVELANNELHSICEIGVARFRAGNLVETWRAVINPECEFEKVFHSNIHGLQKHHAAEAARFPEVYETLKRFLHGEICVFHAASNFDPNCIQHACARYSLEDITQSGIWLSTLDLSYQHWPSESSHKLESLCKRIGHDYVPHNALEDSIACAALFRALSGSTSMPAITASGTANDDRPRTFRRVPSHKRGTGLKGSEEGPFAGIFVVYSGVFSAPWDDRSQFEEYLCSLGFTPRGGFSRKTSLLVIGEDAGQRKIETAQEMKIPIMSEAQFFEYIDRKINGDQSN